MPRRETTARRPPREARVESVRRRSLYVLTLAGAIGALVSLYLPWEEQAGCGAVAPALHGSKPAAGLQNLFAGCGFDSSLNAWSSVGDIVGLLSLALVLATVALFCGRSALDPLWLDGAALALAYFMLATVLQARIAGRNEAIELAGGLRAGSVPYHAGYGMYIGVASAGLVGLSLLPDLGFRMALRVRMDGALHLRSALSRALLVGMLASLLFAWERVAVTKGFTANVLGVGTPSGEVAALLGLSLLAFRGSRSQADASRLLTLSLAVILFAAAAADAAVEPTVRSARGVAAWVGLSVALGSTVVSVTDRDLLPRLRQLRLLPVASTAAGAAVAGSLFLPWQSVCFGRSSGFTATGVSGRCISTPNLGLAGSASALVAIAIVFVIVRPGRHLLWPLELGLALAFLLTASELSLIRDTVEGERFRSGSGAVVCVAASAALIACCLARMRGSIGFRVTLESGVAAAVAASYAAAVVVPWWNVLPQSFWSHFDRSRAGISWLTLVEGLLAIHLAGAWAQLGPRTPPRMGADGRRHDELLVIALALAALPVIATFSGLDGQLTWNTAVLGGLAAILVALVPVDRAGGLGNIELPDILRLDQI